MVKLYIVWLGTKTDDVIKNVRSYSSVPQSHEVGNQSGEWVGYLWKSSIKPLLQNCVVIIKRSICDKVGVLMSNVMYEVGNNIWIVVAILWVPSTMLTLMLTMLTMLNCNKFIKIFARFCSDVVVEWYSCGTCLEQVINPNLSTRDHVDKYQSFEKRLNKKQFTIHPSMYNSIKAGVISIRYRTKLSGRTVWWVYSLWPFCLINPT